MFFVIANILMHLNHILFRIGIELAGHSSDGDPKLLSAMCFYVSHSPTLVIQDTTHIATKLRNRILKPDVNLVMGKFNVSVDHLKALVRNVQKSVHGLAQLDVHPIDRMNFESFAKIVDQRVVDALKQYIPNSDGTIKYLNVCKDVTSCFLQLDLEPLERIFRMWRSVYFLRIWRCFILSTRMYTLANSFITSNAYTCIEINARNLILLVKKFRDQNTPEQFIPSLFDSQSCEKAFRKFRSMGTAQYTKINFSLHDLLHMIGRVEVQNEISYFTLKNKGISFPHQKMGKTAIYPLPSDLEINATIERAREVAIMEAAQFGMNDVAHINTFKIVSNLSIDDNEDDFIDDAEISQEFDDWNDESTENQIFSEHIDEKSPYTTVYDENDVKRIVRKSTLVWMLCEPNETLSNDRLRRVQVDKKTIDKKRKINDS